MSEIMATPACLSLASSSLIVLLGDGGEGAAASAEYSPKRRMVGQLLHQLLLLLHTVKEGRRIVRRPPGKKLANCYLFLSFAVLSLSALSEMLRVSHFLLLLPFLSFPSAGGSESLLQ